MLRRFSLNFAIFSVAIDALSVLAALQMSAWTRPLLNTTGWFAFLPGPIDLPTPLFIVFPLVSIAVLASLSIYDAKRFIKAVDEFTALTLACTLAAIAQAGVLYFSFREVSRAQYLLFALLSYAALLSWRILARLSFRLRGQNAAEVSRRIVIVGSGPLGRMVQARLAEEPALGPSLLGFVDDEVAEGFNGELIGNTACLAELTMKLGATDVVVALPPHFYERTHAVVTLMREVPVKVWIALGFFDLALYRTATEDLAGLPLLDLRASALNDYERFVKRVFDILFGGLALIVLAPVVLLSGLAVKIWDGGPVFFSQDRIGENGRRFTILKLRSMVVNAETQRDPPGGPADGSEAIRKGRGDPRVTPIGRVLRRFSLDEIPQLINVLRGEMSLVGPRPELPMLVEQYEPWQRQRLAVPPGMTGWWQVTGRSDKVMHLNTQDDIYYVRNYTIWLDLSILVRTLWVVILGRGAY